MERYWDIGAHIYQNENHLLTQDFLNMEFAL